MCNECDFQKRRAFDTEQMWRRRELDLRKLLDESRAREKNCPKCAALNEEIATLNNTIKGLQLNLGRAKAQLDKRTNPTGSQE